jgi:hypothetical protein
MCASVEPARRRVKDAEIRALRAGGHPREPADTAPKTITTIHCNTPYNSFSLT